MCIIVNRINSIESKKYLRIKKMLGKIKMLYGKEMPVNEYGKESVIYSNHNFIDDKNIDYRIGFENASKVNVYDKYDDESESESELDDEKSSKSDKYMWNQVIRDTIMEYYSLLSTKTLMEEPHFTSEFIPKLRTTIYNSSTWMNALKNTEMFLSITDTIRKLEKSGYSSLESEITGWENRKNLLKIYMQKNLRCIEI